MLQISGRVKYKVDKFVNDKGEQVGYSTMQLIDANGEVVGDFHPNRIRLTEGCFVTAGVEFARRGNVLVLRSVETS